jgi:hypothetical protein
LEPYESGIVSPLDLAYPNAQSWDTDTWRVYFGLSIEYIRGLTSNIRSFHTARGVDHIINTTEVAYRKIGDQKKYESAFDPHDPYWHANEANKFLNELVKIFNSSEVHVYFDRSDQYFLGKDLSSKIAILLHKAIYAASHVNTKEFRMWNVQHNLIWSSFDMLEVRDTKIMKLTRRKLRRMIWKEVQDMDRFPNYKGASYIRFCLNVLGFYYE